MQPRQPTPNDGVLLNYLCILALVLSLDEEVLAR